MLVLLIYDRMFGDNQLLCEILKFHENTEKMYVPFRYLLLNVVIITFVHRSKLVKTYLIDRIKAKIEKTNKFPIFHLFFR